MALRKFVSAAYERYGKWWFSIGSQTYGPYDTEEDALEARERKRPK
jgi:hypothetical protein